MDRIDFAACVRKLLIDRHMSHGELADRLDLTKQGMSDYLRRRDDYRINADIVRVCDALGYDVQIILIDRQTGQKIECK